MQMFSDNIMKVLVFCKDEHVRGSVELYLKSKGHEVMVATTFKAALEFLGQHNTDMIISIQERLSPEALDFVKESRKVRTASHAYRIILCDPCAPENECDGLEQYADLCIQRPLTKEAIDQALLNVNKPSEKTT